MKKKLFTVSIYCSLAMLIPHLPVQAKTIGYNGECRSSSKWKQAKQYQFSTQGKSYRLIESHKPDTKYLKFSYVSFCLAQGNSVIPLKIFPNNRSFSLSSTGNSSNFKKVGDSIFTISFTYDAGDVGNILLYRIDMHNSQNPQVTLLKTSYG